MRAARPLRIIAIALLGLANVFCSTAGAQNTSAPGRFGTVALTANFRPDPYMAEVAAGGNTDATALGGNCNGFINSVQPDYELDYSNPGNFNLGFFAVSAVDTTLVINDPNGNWYCNDDFNTRGGTNAGIIISEPSAGSYDVWVGVYERYDSGATAKLVISEIGAPWDARFGVTELTANFSPDPFVMEIVAGGNDDAAALADGCGGFVSAARPDYDLVYREAGRYTLSIFAEGDVDSTLAIRAPDGSWHCNDDFAGGGHNPGVIFANPVDGTYSIWVGVYEQAATGQVVNLYVTETGMPPWQSRSTGEGAAAPLTPRLATR